MEAKTWTEIAGAMVPCPNVRPGGKLGAVDCIEECPLCRGRNLVHVFPDATGVRKPCTCWCHNDTARASGQYCENGCGYCGEPYTDFPNTPPRRGWTASRDLATWLEATLSVLFPVKVTAVIDDWRFEWIHGGTDPETAFRAALTAALELRGVRWGE